MATRDMLTFPVREGAVPWKERSVPAQEGYLATTIRDIQDQVEALVAAAGFEQTNLEQQLAFLVSEVGEVAREVLALSAAGDAGAAAAIKERLGMELYDVIWNACAIAALAGVDLEAGIARKVALNKTRTWKRNGERDGNGGR